MYIYEYEFVALLFFMFGVYALVKGRLVFKIVSGQGGLNTIIDESKPKTVHKEIYLSVLATRILGLTIIGVSVLIFVNFKGNVMFIL